MTRRGPVPEKALCHCDGYGWVYTRVTGPDGHVRTEVRPCRFHRPDTADRHDDGYRRDDPAIRRHRRRQDRRKGRR